MTSQITRAEKTAAEPIKRGGLYESGYAYSRKSVVVLASSAEDDGGVFEGVVVYSEDPVWSVGERYASFSPDFFVPFEGTLTLSNHSEKT